MTKCYDDDMDAAEEHELISVKVGERIVVEAISIGPVPPSPEPMTGTLFVRGADNQLVYTAAVQSGVNQLVEYRDHIRVSSIWIEWAE